MRMGEHKSPYLLLTQLFHESFLLPACVTPCPCSSDIFENSLCLHSLNDHL